LAANISYADVEVGTPIPAQDLAVLRVNLLRYCGASSDVSYTHWNERVAKAVGLPNVIAQGTFTIAQAVRVVSDWVGDPGAVVEYRGRFSRPVVVPDDDKGATLHISGAVEEKLDDNRVVVRMSARSGEGEVLSGARVVVRLA
jgi:acyl dehydratase